LAPQWNSIKLAAGAFEFLSRIGRFHELPDGEASRETRGKRPFFHVSRRCRRRRRRRRRVPFSVLIRRLSRGPIRKTSIRHGSPERDYFDPRTLTGDTIVLRSRSDYKLHCLAEFQATPIAIARKKNQKPPKEPELSPVSHFLPLARQSRGPVAIEGRSAQKSPAMRLAPVAVRA